MRDNSQTVDCLNQHRKGEQLNTYITDSLKRIKTILVSDEQPSFESIDSTIGEFEIMKMEIKQHITNMPQKEEPMQTAWAFLYTQTRF